MDESRKHAPVVYLRVIKKGLQGKFIGKKFYFRRLFH